MECANHVFSQCMIDGCFSAHRRVDLGEQGSGDLYEIHAALIGCGRKSRQVADHAATERDQHCITIEAILEQVREHAIECIQRLE